MLFDCSFEQLDVLKRMDLLNVIFNAIFSFRITNMPLGSLFQLLQFLGVFKKFFFLEYT